MRLKKYLNIKQKAGVIPYYIDENGVTSILLMKPSDPAYGGNKYQIAKGNIDEGETIEEAALREGGEELGLKEDNSIGSFFVGCNNVKDYELHIYAVRVKDRKDFNMPHYETDSVRWFMNNETRDIREEHIPLIRRCFSINEWKVHKSYSGRDLIKPNETVLWQHIPSKGLLHTYPDGTTYLDGKEIGSMIRSDSTDATHKKQLASFYNILGFKDSNKRRWIESNYESFVRGRIVGNDLYVYSSNYVGIEAKKYDKMVDRAIDAIYDFVEDQYVR